MKSFRDDTTITIIQNTEVFDRLGEAGDEVACEGRCGVGPDDEVLSLGVAARDLACGGVDGHVPEGEGDVRRGSRAHYGCARRLEEDIRLGGAGEGEAEVTDTRRWRKCDDVSVGWAQMRKQSLLADCSA